MSEVLIPFAIHRDNHMVEVFDVPRGRDCNCRCPSCGQGVIARHGQKTVWHFAHDPKADDKPYQACELSFFSCCRLYLIERALAGELSSLSLPELVVAERIGKYRPILKKGRVNRAQKLEISEYRTDGPFDLQARLGNHTLAIYIDYPGRLPPDLPEDEFTGVLAVDITQLEARYRRGPERQKRILPVLQSLFSDSPDWPESIYWLYHPRTEAVRAKLRNALLKEYDPAKDQPCFTSQSRRRVPAFNPAPPKPPQPVQIRESGPSGVFRCLKCQNKWKGRKFLHATCDSCRTHLYSQFHEHQSPDRSV